MLRSTLRFCLLGVSLLVAACSSSPPANNNPDQGNNPNPDGGPVGSGAGSLHTRGGEIVDSNDQPVRLLGLSWFGMETDWFAPHGLDRQPLSWMLDRIAELGYNTLRIPFCSQMFDASSMVRNVDFGKNPELAGKKPIEVLDEIIEQAGARKLRIILDRHRPDAYNQSELWYTGAYPEQRWIDDWKMLALRYKGNSTVVGFDLHNEPHGQATWGSGNMANDWRLAAERAGNAILSVNPDLLIIVEGIENVNNNYYWWGGNLMAAGDNPVRLSVANRVVYSPHDYPQSIYGQPWFSSPNYPNNLSGVWDMYWGYLVKQNIAPIWIGELGTKYETNSDKQWLSSLVSYIVTNKLSFSYWCWNPNSNDTGGILKDDWMSIQTEKQAALQPALAP
jgi:endoglucanase